MELSLAPRGCARVTPTGRRFAAAVDAPEYGVLARHGHEWDEHTHGWRFRRRRAAAEAEPVDRFAPEAYEVMAIGEAVTAKLMSGLVFHARDQGAPASLVDQLKDVNNLRPLLDVFAWLEWVGGSPRAGAPADVARGASPGARGAALVHPGPSVGPAETDYLVSGDLVDRLEQARAVLLGPDFESFRGRVESLERLQRLVPALLPSEDGLLAGARAEGVFQGEPVRRNPAGDLRPHPPGQTRLLLRHARRCGPDVRQYRHLPPAHHPRARRPDLRERAADDDGVRLPRGRGHAGEARGNDVGGISGTAPAENSMAEAPAHPVGTAAQRARAS